MSATAIFALDAGVGAPVSALAFAGDGAFFSIATQKTVVVVTWPDHRITARLAPPAPVNGLAFSPDGARLAAACADDLLVVFDLSAGTQTAQVTSEFGGFSTVAWSPDGRWIAAGNYEPFVALIDAASGSAVRTLDPDIFSDEGRTALQFLPDGRLAVTAYNRIVLWTLPADPARAPKRKAFGLTGHTFLVDLAFDPGRGRIAALARAEAETWLHAWDAQTQKSIGSARSAPHAQRIAWRTGTSAIAVAGEEGVALCNADRSLAVIPDATFDADVTAMAAHPREPVIAIGDRSGRATVLTFGDTTA